MFCFADTPTCNELYNELSKAVKEALTDHGSRLDMLLCVTVTEDLEENSTIPSEMINNYCSYDLLLSVCSHLYKLPL